MHFAVGRYVPRSLIDASWGRGFVHIKLLGDLPVGSGALAEARVAARYLSKYVAKSLEEQRLPRGMHRYDLAQGFVPARLRFRGVHAEAVMEAAVRLFGGEAPQRFWSSQQNEFWSAPPAIWAQWA